MLRDEVVSFPMTHADAATFFAAVTTGGPLRALADTRGPEFIRDLGGAFLARAPTGPWTHQPSARHLLARRGAQPTEPENGRNSRVSPIRPGGRKV